MPRTIKVLTGEYENTRLTLALVDYGGHFTLEGRNTRTDRRFVIATWDYAGHADRTATRAMLLGTLASLAQQVNAGALGETDLDANLVPPATPAAPAEPERPFPTITKHATENGDPPEEPAGPNGLPLPTARVYAILPAAAAPRLDPVPMLVDAARHAYAEKAEAFAADVDARGFDAVAAREYHALPYHLRTYATKPDAYHFLGRLERASPYLVGRYVVVEITPADVRAALAIAYSEALA